MENKIDLRDEHGFLWRGRWWVAMSDLSLGLDEGGGWVSIDSAGRAYALIVGEKGDRFVALLELAFEGGMTVDVAWAFYERNGSAAFDSSVIRNLGRGEKLLPAVESVLSDVPSRPIPPEWRAVDLAAWRALDGVCDASASAWLLLLLSECSADSEVQRIKGTLDSVRGLVRDYSEIPRVTAIECGFLSYTGEGLDWMDLDRVVREALLPAMHSAVRAVARRLWGVGHGF